MKFKIGALMSAPALLLLMPTVVRAEETVWLSSLDLVQATQGFGKPQQDKSIDGHVLTLSGQTYAHGFGTHSPGLLVLDLKGGSKRFTATVGIDDEVPAGKGSAEFEVLDAAHKILWRSGLLHRGDAPKQVDLDLTGLQQIALRVTTGGDGFEFDHADWADAKFEVTGAHPQTIKAAGSDPVISLTPEMATPKIRMPSVVSVRTGTPLIWTVPVTGQRPFTFAVQGLPRPLKIHSGTGTITGTVAIPGDYSLHVRVKNGAGHDESTIHVLVGDNLVATPSLGWNSYDCFGDDVTEAEVLANARYVADNMQPVGWDTIVVDYRWYDPGASIAPNNTGARAGAQLTMDANGRLLPSPNRFPSSANRQGFKGLADQVHAMGLKFGIHIMRGIPRNAVKADVPIEGSSFKTSEAGNTADTCGWCPDMYGVRGNTPAGKAYYDSLFRLYASWGIDYVKMDDTSSPYHTDEIEAVHSAIAKCGRSIVYSLSPGETPVEQARHVETHANLWRVSGDFWDDWTALDHEFMLGRRWHDFAAPGHWPDADMLPLGHLSIANRSVGMDRRTNFTKSEQVTLISLWSILPSPLMVGANLPDNDPWTKALLTNPEVLAINQDALAAPGTPVSQGEEVEVWSKKLADGSLAVGLFNRNVFDQTVTADWSTLGLTGRYRVRDLWQRKDMGNFNGKYEASVPGHGTVLLRLTRVR